MNNNSIGDPNMFYGIYSNSQRNHMNQAIQETQDDNNRIANRNNNDNIIAPETAIQNNKHNIDSTQHNNINHNIQDQMITSNLRNNTLTTNNTTGNNSMPDQMISSNLRNNLNPSLVYNNINNPICSPIDQTCTITQDDIQYMDGFIGMHIGRGVNIDFLIGNNNLIQKSGNLVGVGRDYILITEFGTDDIIACRLDDIRFITFLEN